MLTKKQQEAVAHLSGPMMVTAGPGSGKTTVLTMRIQRLCQATKPERICVITFARKAAREMKERFAALAGPQIASRVTFGTFHSVFLRWLKAWGSVPENVRIISEEDQLHFIEEQGWDMSGFPDMNPALFLCQRDNARRYEAWKKRRGMIDFDDILKLTDHEIARHKVWQSYDYFLIDEFQDIDELQYGIVKKMAGPPANLFVVGDEDQSIYAFRGSRPELFLRFPKDFPSCRQVELSENFRCSGEIMEASAGLIAHNKMRTHKKLHAYKGQSGESVSVARFSSPTREYREMARIIRRDHRQKKIPYSQMAVLLRTRAQVYAARQALREICVPVRMMLSEEETGTHTARPHSWSRFLNLWDDLWQIYRLARKKTPSRREIMTASEIFPILLSITDDEGVGTRSVSSLLLEHAYGSLEEKTQAELLSYWLRKVSCQKGRLGVRNLLLFTDYLPNLSARMKRSHVPFLAVARQLLRLIIPSFRMGQDRVNVGTMHAAKGLEFEYVYLPGLSEGLCPRPEATLRAAKQQSDLPLEEERRLLYVAMTRAKKYLKLSYSDEAGGPSRFLKETGLHGIMNHNP